MIRALQIEFEGVLLFLLAAALGIIFSFYAGHKNPQQYRISLPIIGTNISPQPKADGPLVQTPLSQLPKPQIITQSSPDGKKLLTMTITANNNNTKTYTFVTSDADGTNRQKVYEAIFAKETMEIPFNAWSPDDALVYIRYTTPLEKDALVMRADGQPFTTGETTINATATFEQKQPTTIATNDVTGWASETLLISNTTLQDGSRGPSYWLEVPSKAVIPLSNQF